MARSSMNETRQKDLVLRALANGATLSAIVASGRQGLRCSNGGTTTRLLLRGIKGR